MLRRLLVIGAIALIFLGWQAYSGHQKKTKKITTSRSEASAIEAVVHLFADEHPHLWKKFYHQHFELSQDSPRAFIKLLARKNGEWVSWLLQKEGCSIERLSANDLEYLAQEIVAVEMGSLKLPIASQADIGISQLELTESEIRRINHKFYGCVLLDETKKAFEMRRFMHLDD